ncbi:hypothetical protein OUY22_09175 [Nonomuraea sp. MCN248]|uniref:DUF4367 domain-containing protein n=1 Tax=Nonomuraea corallina TaxID=2989783 RepID=A0ABT4S8T8_9ACTN|nr:hypothetical protein [Nonomuraea corallina]MDA0633589.1 hypothetical protein [Nonomuraea corallina]
MPRLENEIRRLMEGETARLRAAPDLLDRVMRLRRARRARVKTAVVTASVLASVAVVAAPAVHLATVAQQTTPPATTSATLEPPAIDDTPPARTEPENLGDLGDGLAFGHVKVGHLPEGLRWSTWSLNLGDMYSTSYIYEGDERSSYRVQIFIYEKETVHEVTERIQRYRDEKDGEDVMIGDRSGYLVVQHVGEDGMAGSPSLYLKMGDRQWAEITFSAVYAKEFSGAEAVNTELRKIAEGLTSTL